MAEITRKEWNGQQIYQLSNQGLTASINPEDGLNLFQLCFHEMELVSYNKERAEAGVTYGIPILFPTPNRTRDLTFSFEGKNYPAKMHGIARKAPFIVEETIANAEEAKIKGRFSVEKDAVFFDEFPFLCTLTVTISLRKDSIEYQYEVENQDVKRLPFGFALHPFFCKISEDTLLCLTADKVMMKDEEFLPTGEVLEVKETPFDLTTGKKVKELALDDVYTKVAKSPNAIITYPDFQIEIDSSRDFSHMVVYTPQKESFFCVEPQTCSTDAINLYEQGEKEASGLIVLEAGEKAAGVVTFKIIE